MFGYPGPQPSCPLSPSIPFIGQNDSGVLVSGAAPGHPPCVEAWSAGQGAVWERPHTPHALAHRPAYGAALCTSGPAPQVSDVCPGGLAVAEDQLAWLVYVAGSIVGERPTEPPASEDRLDGSLTAVVVSLSEYVLARVAAPGAVQCQSLQHLQIAALYFMDNFRKAYLGLRLGLGFGMSHEW